MFLPPSSLVSTLAPAWFSLCWLPLSPVELGGCERSYITALHQAISLSLCSHQWGNEKRRKRGRERRKEREKGEVGATKAKRKEQRGEEEGRGGHRVVLFVRRRMNEIFISDAEETRLLSRIISLWFYHSFTSSYSSSPLSLSLHLFLLLPLFSEVSPLVEIRELFFSQPALFCFS